jgi:hypothetical protein
MANTYPEPYKSASLDSLVDPALFYNRECTSYCAWKIHEYTGKWMHSTVPGDAKLWTTVLSANGYKRVDKPTGSGKFVGVLPNSGKYGHVYWWEGGNTVSQYNYGSPAGMYSTMAVNLNDAIWYQITKSSSTKGDDDVITSKDVKQVRTITRDVKGWNPKKVDAGDYDKGEMAAWTGKPWAQLISEGDTEGAAYRKKRDAALAYYAAKAANDKTIATLKLSEQTLQAQIKSDVETLAANTKEIAELERQLSEKQPAAPVDEQKVVENWLVKLWNSLFKKG